MLLNKGHNENSFFYEKLNQVQNARTAGAAAEFSDLCVLFRGSDIIKMIFQLQFKENKHLYCSDLHRCIKAGS